jgi:hypothetical protein
MNADLSAMPPDSAGTSRGFDFVAYSLPVLCLGGLAVAGIGLPGWSIAAALAAALLGVTVAVGLANVSRPFPLWAEASGLAAAIFVSALAAPLSMRVMIVPLAFASALVCAALLARRQRLRR